MKTMNKNIIATMAIFSLFFTALASVRAADSFRVVNLSYEQDADAPLRDAGGSVFLLIEAMEGGAVDNGYFGTAQVSVDAGGSVFIDNAAIHINPTLNAVFPYLNPPLNPPMINFANGSWTGRILISEAKKDITLYIHDDMNGIEGYSNLMYNRVGSRAYLWFTLPGEVYTQGRYPGNSGTPQTFTAGQTLQLVHNAIVRSIDKSYNLVPVDPLETLTITSSNSVITPALSSFSMPEVGEQQISGITFRSANWNTGVVLKATLNAGEGYSNPIIVYPNDYKNIIVCPPDQQLIPGGEFRGGRWEPKTIGAPIIQRVGVPFTITAYLTDTYFNEVQLNAALPAWPTLEVWIDGENTGVYTGGNDEIEFFGPHRMLDVTFNDIGTHEIFFYDKTTASHFTSEKIYIEVLPGELETFEIIAPPAANAGESFNIRITAWDSAHNRIENFVGLVNIKLVSYGNEILYNHAIVPDSAVFMAADLGRITIPVQVNYAGEGMGLIDDHLRIKVSTNTPSPKFGLSNEFNIYEHQSIFHDIVLILPGQQYQPGGDPPFKAGTANSVYAGDPFNIEIYAVDDLGNRIDRDDEVVISSITGVNFVCGGDINLTDGKAVMPMTVYTAGTSTITANVGVHQDSSPITIKPRSYTESTGKLVLLLNGETHYPGWGAPGKIGSPSTVVAHTTMTVTLFACDKFYNRDTFYNVGNVSLFSSDSAIAMKSIGFTNGMVVIDDLYLKGNNTSPVYVLVTAIDQDNTAKQSISNVLVDTGAIFTIDVPASVPIGDPFTVTVNLAKGPDTNYNHRIYLNAVKVDNSAALVDLAVPELMLLNGTATTNTQRFEQVENIKIKVTDDYGRIGYSPVIAVQPKGLKYVIEGPSVATTDDLFDVTVKLYEVTYDTHVITCLPDHNVAVVIEEADGDPAVGNYPVHQIWMHNGAAHFKQSYTKAEDIALVASSTLMGFNPMSKLNIHMLPGRYVKVQIIAPGEIERPGIPSATGKDSSGLVPQAANVGFEITVNAVDKYWNIIPDVAADRRIQLSASDGSLVELPLGFYDGTGKAFFHNVTLRLPPRVTVTAHDIRGDVYSDSVVIYISGCTYQIECKPNYPAGLPDRFVSGINFDMTVTYMTFSSLGVGTTIHQQTAFNLIPLDKNLKPLDLSNLENTAHPLDGNRFIIDADGSSTFTVQYNVAEDVIFKAYDDSGWIGYSTNMLDGQSVIHFVPEDIYYEVSIPHTGIAGPPETFTMRIAHRDSNTDTIAKNFASAAYITVTDVSNAFGRSDGTLLVEECQVTNGSKQFEQAFTRAGIITISIDDHAGHTASGVINLYAASLARLEDTIPASIEAGLSRDIQLSLYDHYDNPIEHMPVMVSIDDDMVNLQLGSLDLMTLESNALGVSSARLSVQSGYSGKIFFTVQAGEVHVNKTIKVLGPPMTSLYFGGLARDTFKGHSLKQTDPIMLEAQYDKELLLDRIMYSIDDGAWVRYTGPFTITDVGIHTLEYYSVTKGTLEHAEQIHQSMKIFITAAALPEDGMINYPNPFMAGKEPTFIEYYLQADSNVTLTIYDLFGQKIYEHAITEGEMGGRAGLNKIEWDGRNADNIVISNGGYIAVLDVQGEGRHMRRKIAVRK